MSAFIVDNDTIDLLVTAAKHWGGASFLQHLRYTAGRHVDSWQEVGYLLLRANVDSVNDRYCGRIDDAEQGASGAYRFREVNLSLLGSPTTQLAVVAMSLRCYEYQSCEGDGAQARTGWKLAQAIKSVLITQISSLSADAPWGWTRAQSNSTPVRS